MGDHGVVVDDGCMKLHVEGLLTHGKRSPVRHCVVVSCISVCFRVNYWLNGECNLSNCGKKRDLTKI